MKHTLILSAVAAFTCSSIAHATPSPDRAEHTVDWYSTHRDDDLRVLKECRNDRTFGNYPDCENAVRGDKLWYANSLLASNKPATTDSRLSNASDRAVVLALCNQKNAPVTALPPQNVCDEAKRIQEKNQ